MASQLILEAIIYAHPEQLTDDVSDVVDDTACLNVYLPAYAALVKILPREFDDIYDLQQCIEVVNYG
jgi:hypothetical protein